MTVLEATGEIDAGDVWASRRFRTREAGKSSLYRHEVRYAAIEAVLEAVSWSPQADGAPEPVDQGDSGRDRRGPRRRSGRPTGRSTGTRTRTATALSAGFAPRRATRACSTRSRGWSFISSASTARRRCAACPARSSRSAHGAICRATVEGAVWIRHLKRRDTATESSSSFPPRARSRSCGPSSTSPELPAPLHAPLRPGRTFREIAYEEHRWSRLPALRLLQRRDEHGSVPKPARGVPLRPLPTADERDRAHGRHRLLLERHPSERDRGGRRPGGGVVGQPAGDRRRGTRGDRDRFARRALGARAATRQRAACRSRSRPITWWRAKTSCSTRTTGTWGACYGSEYWTYLLPRRVGDELTARLTGPPFTSLGARQAVRDGAARRRLRRDVGRLPLPGPCHGRAAGVAGPTSIVGSRPSGAVAPATRRSSRSTPIAKKSWPGRTDASSATDRSYHEARHHFVHKLGAPCAVASSAIGADPRVRPAGRAA